MKHFGTNPGPLNVLADLCGPYVHDLIRLLNCLFLSVKLFSLSQNLISFGATSWNLTPFCFVYDAELVNSPSQIVIFISTLNLGNM